MGFFETFVHTNVFTEGMVFNVLRCLGFVCYCLLLVFFVAQDAGAGFVILCVCVFFGNCVTNFMSRS